MYVACVGVVALDCGGDSAGSSPRTCFGQPSGHGVCANMGDSGTVGQTTPTTVTVSLGVGSAAAKPPFCNIQPRLDQKDAGGGDERRHHLHSTIWAAGDEKLPLGVVAPAEG